MPAATSTIQTQNRIGNAETPEPTQRAEEIAKIAAGLKAVDQKNLTRAFEAGEQYAMWKALKKRAGNAPSRQQRIQLEQHQELATQLMQRAGMAITEELWQA